MQRGQETKNLKEDLEKRNRQIQKECKELDGTLEKVEALKVIADELLWSIRITFTCLKVHEEYCSSINNIFVY